MICTQESLLGDRSRDSHVEDEVVGFLRALANGESGLSSLHWWRNNEKRFTNIAPLTCKILAIQEIFIASKSGLLQAEALISDFRDTLGDEITSACICVRSWSAFVE